MLVEVIKKGGLRLNGQKVAEGTQVGVEDGLARDWLRQGWVKEPGAAKDAPAAKPGDSK